MPITPNMNLVLPTPTQTPGPTYATQNNNAFTTVDSHDHTSGKGIPVPAAGIGIDGDLPFNNNNLDSVKSTRFYNQSAALSTGSDVGCVYVAGGDLFYNNVSGTQIQLTAGGALNAASIGAIGGDYATSTASEYYTSANQTFYFTSATNTPANLDAGSVAIREVATSSNAISIQSPTSLGSSYNLTLPTALPASTLPLTVTNAGVISTGQIQTTQIADQAVTAGKIANATITSTQIANSTITGTQVANNINLPGTAVTVNSKFVPVSNYNWQMNIIVWPGYSGTPGGFTTSGYGWTAVGDSNLGSANFTFAKSFSSTPTIFYDGAFPVGISLGSFSSTGFTLTGGTGSAFSVIFLGPC